MDVYTFQTAKRIIIGRGATNSLAEHLSVFENVKHVYIIAQKSMQRIGKLEEIVDALSEAGIYAEWNTEVEREPTADNIKNVFKQVPRDRCDLLIGIGGGSILDATKLISVMLTNDQTLENMTGIDRIANPGIPTVLIPTTAGTGSEVTPNAIVTFAEQQLKIGIVSRHLLPELVVLDPVLTLTVPKSVTAATGMDAFTHALESFISKKANPISNMLALEAIKLISKNLVKAYQAGDDLDAREGMLLGSMYGGMALSTAGTAAVHALAYPLGGRFHITHGVANSMLLPHVMRFNQDAIQSKLQQVASVMNLGDDTATEDQAAEQVIHQLEEWVKVLEIPNNLSNFGVEERHVPELAIAAANVTRLMVNNPKPMSISDIENVYRRLLAPES